LFIRHILTTLRLMSNNNLLYICCLITMTISRNIMPLVLACLYPTIIAMLFSIIIKIVTVNDDIDP